MLWKILRKFYRTFENLKETEGTYTIQILSPVSHFLIFSFAYVTESKGWFQEML